MDALIISDLHLTEKPTEEYRWKIFQTARDYLEKNEVRSLYILGDFLDRKDRHPSELVNRLIEELQLCGRVAKETILLMGNHDYLKNGSPFLEFTKHLSFVRWIDKPTAIGNQLWLPHSRTPETEWADCDFIFPLVKTIFMHQSVIGAKASNYYEMNHGLDLEWLTSRTKAKIYSGDIHVPQKIGPLTYIGTPHPVSFGDDYQPRMLHLKGDEEISIPVNTLQRLTLTINDSLELEKLKNDKKLKAGDHLKIRVVLSHKELSRWTEIKAVIKEWCDYNRLVLADVLLERAEDINTDMETTSSKFTTLNPETAFEHYVKSENLDAFLVTTGQDLLKAVLDKGNLT